jgi:branched-chain amino acid aminotransferase
MIWVAGRIVPDDELKISVLDRTFEHGLGLFETLRTWNAHPTLLDRHLMRMKRSASALGLPLDPSQLPDAAAVTALRSADGRGGDAMLRITMSGGVSEHTGSTVWMRSFPLPEPVAPLGATLSYDTAFCSDYMPHVKSLNYWGRRTVYENARRDGFDEMLVLSAQDGRLREGSRTNLFVVTERCVSTPRLDGQLLPGIMRQVVLERAKRLRIPVEETELTPAIEQTSDEIFLTNSVRGIIPVGRFTNRKLAAPGPVTRRLWDDVRTWLESGEPE